MCVCVCVGGGGRVGVQNIGRRVLKGGGGSVYVCVCVCGWRVRVLNTGRRVVEGGSVGGGVGWLLRVQVTSLSINPPR